MTINADNRFFSQKIEELNISDKAKRALVAGGINTLKDIVLLITDKLLEKPGTSIKDATIECLLDIRRFGRDNAIELMEEFKRIDFFEEIDWDIEINERIKAHEDAEKAEYEASRTGKEKVKLAREV